jgi:serine/threonine-protein kinase RsbW
MDTKETNTDVKKTGDWPSRPDGMLSHTFYVPELYRCDLINKILVDLEKFGQNSEVLFMVRLALDEAIINAIMHGHREDSDRPETPVRVDCLLDDSCLAIRVTDSGLGFNPAAVPDPTIEENLWKISGRGIFLMRESMDEVIYSSIGNSVLMIRKLEKGLTKR